MKNKFIKTTLLSLAFLSLSINSVYAKEFRYDFTNKDGKVIFDLSTNMHGIKADVKKFKGHMSVKTEDEKTIDEVEGLLEIDATSITTNIWLCDNRMQKETLNTAKFPKIIFKVLKVVIVSNRVDIDNTVTLKMSGDLTIRDITKKVEIPVKINVAKNRTSATVEGRYKVNFSDYNVPDPSILIARVSPIVDLSFILNILKVH